MLAKQPLRFIFSVICSKKWRCRQFFRYPRKISTRGDKNSNSKSFILCHPHYFFRLLKQRNTKTQISTAKRSKKYNLQKWPLKSFRSPQSKVTTFFWFFHNAQIFTVGGIKTSYHRYNGVSVGWVTSFVGE